MQVSFATDGKQARVKSTVVALHAQTLQFVLKKEINRFALFVCLYRFEKEFVFSGWIAMHCSSCIRDAVLQRQNFKFC